MDKKIKILHIVGIMNTGGIETWLMNVLRNIDRTKVQFDFVVHTDKKGYYDGEIDKFGGTIIRVPKFKIININAYKKAWKKILESNHYKILHSHIRSTAPIYLKIAKQYNIITIAHAHNTSNGKFPVSLIKDIFQRKIGMYSDIRLACSNEAGIWLFKNLTFRIIKNAIDISLYALNDEIRSEYRKKYSVEKNIVIGHIGRFNHQKNHCFLLEIFKELHKTNNSFRLVLVGDGESKKEIEDEIKKLNIIDSVICTGVRSDIPQLLQMFDIFIFPSHYEGLGIALIEAQAAGLQCFVSNNIPKEAIITNNVISLSLKATATYWANQIINKLNIEKSNNISCIQKNGFDINLVAEELENLYGSIAKNNDNC